MPEDKLFIVEVERDKHEKEYTNVRAPDQVEAWKRAKEHYGQSVTKVFPVIEKK